MEEGVEDCTRAPDASRPGLLFLKGLDHTMEAVSRCNTRRLVWTALLSALAAVLMYIDMALPIFPRFLKIDISDLPALVASFSYGPVA